MKTYIATVLYWCGYKHRFSTFVDEDTITAGYGELYPIGTFEYPLPNRIIRKLCKGHTSWMEYSKTFQK